MTRKSKRVSEATIKAKADRAEATASGADPDSVALPPTYDPLNPPEEAKAKAEAKKRIKYSTELAAQICEYVAAGLSLSQACAQDGMPSRRTATRWTMLHEEFGLMYARAREERADLLAEEIIEIADTEPNSNKARVRIDARKWWAAKVNPKKYGDKQEVNVTADHKHHHSQSAVSEDTEWLARLLGTGADQPIPAPKPH